MPAEVFLESVCSFAVFRRVPPVVRVRTSTQSDFSWRLGSDNGDASAVCMLGIVSPSATGRRPKRRASGHDGVVAAILVGDRWGREELDPADYLR